MFGNLTAMILPSFQGVIPTGQRAALQASLLMNDHPRGTPVLHEVKNMQEELMTVLRSGDINRFGELAELESGDIARFDD